MQVERYYRNIKKHSQQLRSLQNEEIKSSATDQVHLQKAKTRYTN